MNDDDWQSWKNGKHDNRYRGVKRHSGQRNYKAPVIVSMIIGIVILGYFVYQTYGITQPIQNESNKIITDAENKIRQVTPLLANLSSSQSKPFPLTNQDTRIPIAVYDNCNSIIERYHKYIDTMCFFNNPLSNPEKQFKFFLPSVLERDSPVIDTNVKTKLYQYGPNDFKIGLYDQVGEKNYTVTLWELPR